MTGFGNLHGRHRAEQLVAAVTHHDVVRTDEAVHGRAEELQERVTGKMALGVVDLFEPVDIDEGEHERGAGAVGARELARDFLEAEPSHPRARQLVLARKLEAACELGLEAVGLGAFARRKVPIRGCLRAVLGCSPSPSSSSPFLRWPPPPAGSWPAGSRPRSRGP